MNTYSTSICVALICNLTGSFLYNPYFFQTVQCVARSLVPPHFGEQPVELLISPAKLFYCFVSFFFHWKSISSVKQTFFSYSSYPTNNHQKKKSINVISVFQMFIKTYQCFNYRNKGYIDNFEKVGVWEHESWISLCRSVVINSAAADRCNQEDNWY